MLKAQDEVVSKTDDDDLTVRLLPSPWTSGRGSPRGVQAYGSCHPRLLCQDEQVEAILRGVHSGRCGDGKAFVTQVERIVSVRNRETGDAAI